jgi:transposase-like protein
MPEKRRKFDAEFREGAVRQAARIISHYATPDSPEAPRVWAINGHHAARTARGSTSSSHRSTSRTPST